MMSSPHDFEDDAATATAASRAAGVELDELSLPELAWMLSISPFAGLEGRPLDWRLPTAVSTACLAELLLSGSAWLEGNMLIVGAQLPSPPDSQCGDFVGPGDRWNERVADLLVSSTGATAPISERLRVLHGPAPEWAAAGCVDHGIATVVHYGVFRRRAVAAPTRPARDQLVRAVRQRLRVDPLPLDRLAAVVSIVSAVGAADRALAPTPLPDWWATRRAAEFADVFPYPELLRQATIALQRPITGS